jgi:hypothetical protein
MSGIFLRQGDELVEMAERPYELEDRLQELLARHPNLLAGDQIDPDSPRRWLPVAREVALRADEAGAGPWSVDHLFLDQNGVPTIVEVKRGTDTRIRREVVGQPDLSRPRTRGLHNANVSGAYRDRSAAVGEPSPVKRGRASAWHARSRCG